MIYTIIGDNQYLKKQAINKILSEHKVNELSVEDFDAEETDYQQLVGSVANFSLFSTDKVVIIRRFSSCKQFTDNIEQIINTIPSSTTLILTDIKVDKRSVYVKTLKKHTEFTEFLIDKSANLVQWAIEFSAKCSAKLSASDANYLIGRVGANQDVLASEITKLSINNTQINRQLIDELTVESPSSSVFNLIDSAFAGNINQTIRLYDDQRRQKVEPLAILGLLAWQLHILAVVKAGEIANISDISQKSGLNSFVVSKAKRITAVMTLAKIKDLVLTAKELDRRLKSEPINGDDALKLFLIRDIAGV
jgi:DNA polymerase III subunit delta